LTLYVDISIAIKVAREEAADKLCGSVEEEIRDLLVKGAVTEMSF
jgi:hypothetical protein